MIKTTFYSFQIERSFVKGNEITERNGYVVMDSGHSHPTVMTGEFR